MFNKKTASTYHFFEARDNIYRHALSESLWALTLIDTLSDDEQAIYKNLIIEQNNMHLVHQKKDSHFLVKNNLSEIGFIIYFKIMDGLVEKLV